MANCCRIRGWRLAVGVFVMAAGLCSCHARGEGLPTSGRGVCAAEDSAHSAARLHEDASVWMMTCRRCALAEHPGFTHHFRRRLAKRVCPVAAQEAALPRSEAGAAPMG